MYNIKGDNPTEIYHNAMNDLVENGDEVRPRGKLVKELRPAAIEYDSPFNRVTFLGGRRINPFFQVAESLWILSGRSDVEFLAIFNKNMASFSDDGKTFNAPYGERIIRWGDNNAHGVKAVNSLDQLRDVYKRFLHDKDTRQATIAIGNPSFDNSKYLVEEKGRDIACNLYITFKIRKDKLHMVVFNRSNDLHWGVFGANLCQFTTIQETLFSWLKNSGVEEFSNLEIGTYTQITDSLHIYLDDYGAKATKDVIKFYDEHPDFGDNTFTCVDEPRMTFDEADFTCFTEVFWNNYNRIIEFDEDSRLNAVKKLALEFLNGERFIEDPYWNFSVKSMLFYYLIKHDEFECSMSLLDTMESCQWKISMLYFIKNRISKNHNIKAKNNNIVDVYNKQVMAFKDELISKEEFNKLTTYLVL